LPPASTRISTDVATPLRVSGLLPRQLDITPLLVEAERQLHEEADYMREAEQMRRYGAMLAGEEASLVPAPVDELTGPGAPTTGLHRRAPDRRIGSTAPCRRCATAAMGALMDLVLRELFTFRFPCRRDPNFANYRREPEPGKIVLLDFGAARAVPEGNAPCLCADDVCWPQRGSGTAKAPRSARWGLRPKSRSRGTGQRFDGVISVLLEHVDQCRYLLDLADRSFVARLRDFGEPVCRRTGERGTCRRWTRCSCSAR